MSDFLITPNTKIRPINGADYIIEARNVQYQATSSVDPINLKEALDNKSDDTHDHKNKYIQQLSITGVGSTSTNIKAITKIENQNNIIKVTYGNFITGANNDNSTIFDTATIANGNINLSLSSSVTPIKTLESNEVTGDKIVINIAKSNSKLNITYQNLTKSIYNALCKILQSGTNITITSNANNNQITISAN